METLKTITNFRTCTDCPTPRDCAVQAECQWGDLRAVKAVIAPVVYCACDRANVHFNECAYPNCDSGDQDQSNLKNNKNGL